jgi:hypothetical protein
MVHVEREQLWEPLGRERHAFIEPRTGDSVVASRRRFDLGLRAALTAGERYEIALLDSDHAEDHVWEEFLLAAQLVCLFPSRVGRRRGRSRHRYSPGAPAH